jgi:hypothetical protein
MAQTPEERRAAAKRHRLYVLYRITPEEEQCIEQYQRAVETYSLLLQRGDGNNDALTFVDHRHSDGLIRGKLAYLINKALGTIENSYKERTPEILRALATYLDSPPAVEVIGAHYGMIGRAKLNKKVKMYGSASGLIMCKAGKKAGKKA